jgi:hypothetical protein
LADSFRANIRPDAQRRQGFAWTGKAATRALKLDNLLPEAHSTTGHIGMDRFERMK